MPRCRPYHLHQAALPFGRQEKMQHHIHISITHALPHRHSRRRERAEEERCCKAQFHPGKVQSNTVCSVQLTVQSIWIWYVLRDPAPNGMKASFMALLGDSHRDGSKLSISATATLREDDAYLSGSVNICESLCSEYSCVVTVAPPCSQCPTKVLPFSGTTRGRPDGTTG